MYALNTDASPVHCEVRLSGIVTLADLSNLMAQLEHLIALRGGLRILFFLDRVRGSEPRVAWEEIKFGAEHRNDFDRIAIVGRQEVDSWIADLSARFIGADVRWFARRNLDHARDWISS